MGLRASAAAERASALLAEGYDRIDMVSELTLAELKEYGGFKAGDLKKVAAYRQANAPAGTGLLVEGGALRGWETDPDPAPEALSVVPLEEAVPPESSAGVAQMRSLQPHAAAPELPAPGTPAMIPFSRHRPAVPHYNENGDMTQARLLEIRRRMIEIYDATPELQHLPRPELDIGFKHAALARREAKKQTQKANVQGSGYGQRAPSRPKNRHAPASPKAKRKTRGTGARPPQPAAGNGTPASARSGSIKRQSQRRDVL